MGPFAKKLKALVVSLPDLNFGLRDIRQAILAPPTLREPAAPRLPAAHPNGPRIIFIAIATN